MALLLAACGHAPVTVAVVDTLPGGALRVRNTAPSGWTDPARVTFTEVQRIQPEDGQPGELDEVWDLVVGDGGEIYVAEQGPVRVDQFSADGRYLRTIGRQGGGPGEYQVALLAFADGHLVVHDPQLQRTSVFDTAGHFVRSWPSTCCIWKSIGADSLGRVYIPVMPASGAFSDSAGPGWVRYRIDGTVVDTIWRRPQQAAGQYWELKSPQGRSRFIIPFQSGLIDIPWVGGGLLVGDERDYSFTIGPHGTDTALVFGRSYEPVPIPDSVRTATFDRFTARNEKLKAVARVEDIPRVYPAFSDMQVDRAGWIWVRGEPRPGETGTRWDIFAAEGKWLGEVRAPFRYRELQFHGDQAVVLQTMADDRLAIVRYRIGGLAGTDAAER
jgi:hypothetical protein